jgi:HD-GYP domain-containing protein (c-di-GMP phosphodiesterase class II)
MIAVWRHGTSLRAAAAAERFRIAAERFENISKFMRVVTNSQPTAIVAVDGTTRYTFSNEPAAREAGITPEDMLGKTMAGVMGPVKARYYADINRDLLVEFEEAEQAGLEDSVQRTRKQFIHTFDEEDEPQVIKSDHIPLRGDRDHPPGILMVLDDITEFSQERMRSEARMRQLVGTLVNVVDRRDPLSANRSNNISRVAGALARELGGEQVDIDTAEFAGNLLSLGNVYISTDVLSRPAGQLTDDERAALDDAYQVSAELLDGVDFEGPVVDTIRQSHEHVDGTGPLGLAGDNILQPARIIAVAQAFVSRVSPSADGDGESFEAASNALLQESGTIYDRKVVTALLNYIENRGGGGEWSGFRDRPST